MSYTPHTWVDNETITASKLNALEQGVSGAGGGGFDAVIWFPDSTQGWQVEGDFASALAKVQDGKPIVAIYYGGVQSSSAYIYLYAPQICYGFSYDGDNDPTTINLHLDSTVRFVWTASGVEYYD